MKALTRTMALICLGWAMAAAQAANDSDVASKLIALERVGKMQAWHRKDVTAMGAMLDDAFVYVDPKGRVLTKAEMLMQIETTDAPQFTAEAMAVKLHGKTAIVTGLYRMTGREHGKPFVRRGRFVDTWLDKNGQWIAIASLLTPAGN